MKIYLVRHGQSQWQRRPSSNGDTELTDVGHEQARRLGAWLEQRPTIDVATRIEVASVMSSTLQRARQTAASVGAGLGLPVVVDEHLDEPPFHVSDHLPPGDGPLPCAPSGAASQHYLQFKAQAQAALQGLVEQAEQSDGPVMAVAHGGVIKTVLRVVVGSDVATFRLYNTALTLIEWRDERWNVIFVNLWDHLTTALRTR